MGVLTASQARANISQLLDKAATTHEPVPITGKCHNAVFVSEDDWMAIQETLSLLSISGMKESNKAGMEKPIGKLCDGSRLRKWRLLFTKQAKKDTEKLKNTPLQPHSSKLLTILRKNPFQNPPPYEKLVGDLSGVCSRRTNIQHRLVYQILENEKWSKCSACRFIMNDRRQEK